MNKLFLSLFLITSLLQAGQRNWPYFDSENFGTSAIGQNDIDMLESCYFPSDVKPEKEAPIKQDPIKTDKHYSHENNAFKWAHKITHDHKQSVNSISIIELTPQEIAHKTAQIQQAISELKALQKKEGDLIELYLKGIWRPLDEINARAFIAMVFDAWGLAIDMKYLLICDTYNLIHLSSQENKALLERYQSSWKPQSNQDVKSFIHALSIGNDLYIMPDDFIADCALFALIVACLAAFQLSS